MLNVSCKKKTKKNVQIVSLLSLDSPNSRKKKVYEQHENEENPLRCPVKLYEFYISKWLFINLKLIL